MVRMTKDEGNRRTAGLPVLLATLAAAFVVLGGLWLRPSGASGETASAVAVQHAGFVDERQCAECHGTETAAWRKSHHARAMEEPTPQTVLGDFNDAVFTYDGVESRFFREGDEFWVETDGPDGKPGRFRVAYTFGFEPLQQYLIAMPGGRLQSFGIAWDTQAKRWFHLYPDDKLTFRDDLHWTKPQQNANFMCVECHVTDLKRNFDLVTNTFRSDWQALGVGCQSCHGPAARHMEWASAKEPRPALPGSGFEVPLKAAGQQTIVENCGRCHARRAPLGDGFKVGDRLADDYSVALLTDQLYHVDGQIKDEVFEYGSFAQSKMFMAGVSCVSCHEPHGGTLRIQGNALCMQCHGTDESARTARYIAPPQHENYDSFEHTRHRPGTQGSFCVDCHMPGKFFMGVDFRRDHSMMIPRPDLSRKLGAPDACASCHADKGPEWAAGHIEIWFGKKNHPISYGEVMHALRHGGDGATDALKALVQDSQTPPIRKATALADAMRYPGQTVFEAGVKELADNDPIVRTAAIGVVAVLPPETHVTLLKPLLGDPVRQVRIAAARALVAARERLEGTDRENWRKAIDEYREVQTSLGERAESHLNLAGLNRELGWQDEARRELDIALTVDPDFLPAVTMKSEYLAAGGRNADGIALLREALSRHPGSGLLYQALGMAQIRSGTRADALQSFRAAWEKEPGNPAFGLIYAVALHDMGDPQAAIAQLDKVIAAHPESRDAAMTAVRYRVEAKDMQGAQEIAARWLKISPDEPSLGNPARRRRGNEAK